MYLHTSVLRRSKQFQGKYQKGSCKLKLFGLISLFASVSMYYNKFVLPGTVKFSAKLLDREENQFIQ